MCLPGGQIVLFLACPLRIGRARPRLQRQIFHRHWIGKPHKDLFYPIERLIKVLPKLEIPTKELSQIRFFHLLFGLDNDSAKKEKSFLSPTRSKFTMDLTRPLFSASGNPLCRSSNISSHFEPSNAILCHSRWDVAFRRYSNTLLKPLAPLLT